MWFWTASIEGKEIDRYLHQTAVEGEAVNELAMCCGEEV